MPKFLVKKMISVLPIAHPEDSVYPIEEKLRELVGLVSAENGVTSVGVFGPWGGGKTSVLRMCESRLRSEATLTIWLDAWRYTTSPLALWKVIAEKIIYTLRKNLTKEELAAEVSTGTALSELLNQLEATLYRSLAFVETEKSLDYTAIATKAASLGFSALTNALPGGALVGEVIEYLKSNFTEAQSVDEVKSLIKTNESEIFRAELTSVEQFCSMMDKLDEELKSIKKRIVIFLDDLDRCNPDELLHFSVSIRTLLSRENIVVVSACDPKILEMSIGKYWKNFLPDLTETVDHSGVSEKIFDYSIRLKPPSRTDIESIAKIVLEDRLNEKQLKLISDCLPRNFRKSIKFLVKAENTLKASNDDRALSRLKVLAMEEFWPNLAVEVYGNSKYWRNFNKEYSNYQQENNQGQATSPSVALDRLLLSDEFPPITEDSL